MIRLETHCHTKFSKDSLLPFTLLYLKCKLCGISCIAITEHNNIIGATKFKEYCRKRKSNLCVIVGEEIMTESGEVIGLYLKKEIPQGLSCKETIAQIREQKGIVYVPHPYDEKRNKTVLKEECIKRFAPVIDCMELRSLLFGMTCKIEVVRHNLIHHRDLRSKPHLVKEHQAAHIATAFIFISQILTFQNFFRCKL